jgi:hypothetical protein
MSIVAPVPIIEAVSQPDLAIKIKTSLSSRKPPPSRLPCLRV